MKSLRYVALGALAWAGLSVSAFASTEVMSFNGPYSVVCDNGFSEVVALNQTQTFDTKFVIDSNGGTHFNMHTRWSGTATGLTSGSTYQTSGGRTLIDTIAPDQYPAVFNWSYTMRLIGQAQTPNIYWVMRGHSTVNANGDTSSIVDLNSVTCH